MVTYKSKDLTIGLKIELNNEPYVILDINFVNIGRGQAFNKLKLKNILNDIIIIKTVKIGEKIKSADVISKNIKFLYKTDDSYCFFDNILSEYYDVSNNIIAPCKKWMKDGNDYTAIFWNNNIIEIKASKFVELKVISTDDIKRDFGTHKNSKYAKLETDFLIKVPIFIKENDVIKIDTESDEYISRINT
ncbi:MAG TPA: elongation factor P [Candidatus Azoamicus sp. OHIO2]